MFFSLGPGRITFFPLGRKTGIRRNSILGWQSTMGTWKHTEFVYCTHLVHFSGLFWRSVLIFQLNFSFSKSFCASNLKLCIFPFEAATRWLRTPPLAASHGKIHSFKFSAQKQLEKQKFRWKIKTSRQKSLEKCTRRVSTRIFHASWYPKYHFGLRTQSKNDLQAVRWKSTVLQQFDRILPVSEKSILHFLKKSISIF